jgi:hypothetical protein
VGALSLKSLQSTDIVSTHCSFTAAGPGNMASLVKSISVAASTASTAEVVIVTAISISLALLLYVLQRCALLLQAGARPNDGTNSSGQTATQQTQEIR